MTSIVAPVGRNGTEGQTVLGRVTSVVADAGAHVRTTATDTTAVVAEHAPAALAGSRWVIERALGTLRRSTSGSLTLGTAFTAGMSGGMLLSRAPRVLVGLAFLATLLMGGTLVERGTTRREEPHREARS